MRVRCVSRLFRVAAVVFLLSAVLAEGLQAAEQPRSRGRSIQFSEPKSETTGTNVNQLGVRNTGLKNLEDDLFKPLQTFTPKGSLDGVMVQPFRPAPQPSPAQRQRAREILEQRRNWAFSDPDENVSGLTAEEMLKIREFEKESDQHPIARYYDRLSRERGGITNRIEDDFFGARSPHENRDDSTGMDGMRPRQAEMSESERAMRRFFESGPKAPEFFPSANRPAGFGELFGTQPNSPQMEERARAQKARMEEFTELLDSQMRTAPAAPSYDPYSGLGDTTRLAPITSGAIDAGAASRSRSFEPTLTTPSWNPAITPGTLPQLNTGIASRPGLTPATPALPTPQPIRLAPPTPDFSIPKRQF
jgi:hypothetical protein